MSLQIGIVGLPNVGKSTLFNALTKTRGAQAANYPFCTIDPNVGIVEIPDERLQKLADISHAQKIIPAAVEFVDIAGLVKGASQGEGLGNQFLSHIRNVDAILQVIRSFEDENVIHVHGNIDPKIDIEVVNTELILADLDTVSRKCSNVEKKAKTGDKEALFEYEITSKLKQALEKGDLANTLEWNEAEYEYVKTLHLLTGKPFLYVVNMSESELMNFKESDWQQKLNVNSQTRILPLCARLEEELIDLSDTEALEFLSSVGLSESGLVRLVKTAYDVLGLQYYFTSGEKETRAWTIHKGDKAPQAAAVIHTDFEKGFIKAEVTQFSDFIEFKGWNGAKEQGKVRMEGKEYVMKDGDVVLFKINA